MDTKINLTTEDIADILQKQIFPLADCPVVKNQHKSLSLKLKSLSEVYKIGSSVKQMINKSEEFKDVLESLYMILQRNKKYRELILDIARKLNGVD